MPTSTLTPGDEKQDEKNIGQHHADQTFDSLRRAESAGTPDMSSFEDRLADDKLAKDAPSTAEQYTRQREADGSWEDKTEPTTGKTPTKGLRLKKGSALGGIIVVLLGLVGLGGTLFTPSLGIIQMKEVLTTDLNDQLAAMDIRGEHVFRAKLKGMSSGVCTAGIKIKCKFNSMSNRQIDRFKKAGFIVEDGNVKNALFGRKVITSMTAPDGTIIKNPSDLINARRTSPQVRSAMNRVFNPLYYSLADKVANAFLKKNKTGKQKKVVGESDDERRKGVKDATAGEKAGGGAILEDENGRKYMVDDENGTRVYEDGDDADRFRQLKADADEKMAALGDKAKVGGKAVGGVLGGAFKGVSVLGIADSACTVYNTARAVSAAAKVARSIQLIQFAMVINTTADSIKAGDATADEVRFVGEMLASTDQNKTMFDDTTGVEVDNVFYGMSAYDSPGYKTAAYNDAPTLTARSQQYMVGGGMSGTLSDTLTHIEGIIGGSSPSSMRESCGFVQSPWVRGAGLVLGIFAMVGSFGAGTIASVSASIAISFALPFLEAMLADVVAGQVIGEDIRGIDAGDAAFAGNAALLGGIAQQRGLQPLNSDGISTYMAATYTTKNEMVATERYEASKTPFDIHNQYSFLGSFARSLYPISLKAQSSVGGALTSIGSILSLGLSSIAKPMSVNAADVFNEERFSKCNDPGYKELGIDADIFCNVRYGLTEAELKMDSDEVVDFMLSSQHIDRNGKAKGDYARFLEVCVNRADGWGETSEENGSIGLECIDGNKETFANISYFRVFTIDNSISDAMDDDPEAVAGGFGEYVLPLDPGYTISAAFTMYDPFNTGTSYQHMGIDFAGGTASMGSPVYAVADGEVIAIDRGNNNGVIIRHSNGLMSRYMHMELADITVSAGDSVTAGQQIGKVGNYGDSTGAHLHLEFNFNDETDSQFTSIADEHKAIRPDRRSLNPEIVFSMFGIDILNGTYLDGRN